MFPIMKYVSLVALGLGAAFLSAVPVQAQSVSTTLLDCGVNGQGQFVVHSMDTNDPRIAEGVRPGKNCVAAYAKLRRRLEAQARVEDLAVGVGGPEAVSVCHEDPDCPPSTSCEPICSSEDPATSDCLIWDLQDGTPGLPGDPTLTAVPIAHAILLCSQNARARWVVSFFDFAANRSAKLGALELPRGCARARGVVEGRFRELARVWGTEPKVRGPIAGRFLPARENKADDLAWQYELLEPVAPHR